MARAPNIDGVLVQWGDRLFYPGNRIVRSRPLPDLGHSSTRHRAAAIRARIVATVVRRAPQVMVKVTGGGRGMRAIAAHLRYISKHGRLDIEDELGERMKGKDALRDLADDWRFGGTLIAEISDRREAFNIMLSMPRGTEPLAVLQAARGFAKTELADHKYAMVLHDHQANPHVHLSVRAESKHSKRLNPRKEDLQRWRETFAERLRELGIDAEATRQATRGQNQTYEPLWRLKARADGRLRGRVDGSDVRSTTQARTTPSEANNAWTQIAQALAASGEREDRALASSIRKFVDKASVDRSHVRAVKTTETAPRTGSEDIDRRR